MKKLKELCGRQRTTWKILIKKTYLTTISIGIQQMAKDREYWKNAAVRRCLFQAKTCLIQSKSNNCSVILIEIPFLVLTFNF